MILIAVAFIATAIGCVRTPESPLAGHDAFFVEEDLALIDRQIAPPAESPLLAAAARHGLWNPTTGAADVDNPLTLRVGAGGTRGAGGPGDGGWAVAILLPPKRAGQGQRREAPSQLLIWPDWQNPQTFLNLGEVYRLTFFSGTVAVVIRDGRQWAIDLDSGDRRPLPSGASGALHELDGDRLVLDSGTSSAIVWNWRTDHRVDLKQPNIIGVAELPSGFCGVVATPSNRAETRLVNGETSRKIDTIDGLIKDPPSMPFVSVEMLPTSERWIYRIDENGKFRALGAARASRSDLLGFDASDLSPDGSRAICARGVFPTLIAYSVVSTLPRDYGRVLARIPNDYAWKPGRDRLAWLSIRATTPEE